MKTKVILHAPNVHTGGGLVLLRELLEGVESNRSFDAMLDIRAKSSLEIPANVKVFWTSPTLLSRLKAEFLVRRRSSSGGVVFCLHGLPPLLSNSAAIVVMMQNRLLLRIDSLDSFRLKTRLRLIAERATASVLRHRVSSYIVQTQSMKIDLQKWYMRGTLSQTQPKIEIMPFVGNAIRPENSQNENVEWDFIYVADGEAHKNHQRLIEAWILLSMEGIHPSLVITLGKKDQHLIDEIEKISAQYGLVVKNVGHVSHSEIFSLYRRARALIYPSLTESFGLPLLEAREANLPILAGELDYVRDVCEPVESFDPSSALSISRSLKRFLAIRSKPQELLRSQEVWNYVEFSDVK